MAPNGKRPPEASTAADAAWQWVTDDVGAGTPGADRPDDVTTPGADDYSTAFAFVQSLAAELSRGRVDLPTCPEVARGVREALDRGGELSNTLVTRVITSDAGLAARMFSQVNPNTGGARGGNRRAFVDLKLAVTRVGRDKVRSAALPYVLEKLHAAQAHEHIRGELAQLWERSTMVAAIARVLAMRTRVSRFPASSRMRSANSSARPAV